MAVCIVSLSRQKLISSSGLVFVPASVSEGLKMKGGDDGGMREEREKEFNPSPLTKRRSAVRKSVNV